MSKKVIFARVAPTVHAYIIARSKREGVSASELIERILSEKKKKRDYDKQRAAA